MLRQVGALAKQGQNRINLQHKVFFYVWAAQG